MQHIYRQIIGLEHGGRMRPQVLTFRRDNREIFEWDERRSIDYGKPSGLWWKREWHHKLRREPWMLGEREVRRIVLDLMRVDASLLHVYFGHTGLHLLPLLKACPVPTVVSFHGADAGVRMELPRYREAMAEMLGVVDRIFVRSAALGRDVELLGADPLRVRVQKTAIPTARWRWVEREVPEGGEWRLLQACRLLPKKGIGTTLRAFAEVRKSYPKAGLHLAGDGAMRVELEGLARELGVERAVEFHGFLGEDELRELAGSCHLFLHPSEVGPDGSREGVPNSMLEAMATGLPVVATRHGGIGEVVVEGESGLLVGERDHMAMAAAIGELLGRPRKLRRMGRMARRVVKDQHAVEGTTERLERLYCELLPGWAEAAGVDGQFLTSGVERH
jgi:colanic acid/amylovoran biosynthesis glycosyltransferase